MTAQLSKDIYNLVFGKFSGDCEEDEDLKQESGENFWVAWGDTEWQEILQKRKESGNHNAI